MNYKKIINYLGSTLIMLLVVSACTDDLNTIPNDPDIVTAATVYDDPTAYKQVLAKIYAGLALSGQQGPAGQADIEGIDEGFGQYLRAYWYHQELPTDEAIIGWNDQTIKDFHEQDWGTSDVFISAMYYRIFYQISICNEFLRETTPDKLSSRGVDAGLTAEIEGFRSEVRFLRALSYWHALDLFRNVPFVTEEDIVGSFLPEQVQAPQLFEYIESELLDIENTIAPARGNEYARADQAAVWTLLAKLYLNAREYTGSNRYGDCLEYCEKVIGAGYELDPVYANVFLADNHNSPEIIFPIAFDGINTRTFGGMTFIIRAGIGGDMDPDESGVESGWGGTRTTRQLVELFPEDAGGIVAVASEGSTVLYPKLNVPGAHQGWNVFDSDNTLSAPNSDRQYEGHIYFAEDNSPFLFTDLPTLDLWRGDNGADGTLEMFGDTIRSGDAGLHRFTVDWNNNTYTLDPIEWGIVGDATPGGWDNDTPMTWNEEEKALEAFVTLEEGKQMKFRANGEWTINLGTSDDDDAILVQEGGDYTVPKSGEYQVLLYIDKPDYSFELRLSSFDSRPMFFTNGQNIDIDDVTLFTEGYAVRKFKNVTSDGQQGSDSEFPDTDFPMFRLGDIFLMASEAIVRDNGDLEQAAIYFNEVRTRAYGSTGANVSADQLTLELLRDERARELYWECHRRTDLVRFGDLTETDYVWAWKGGVPQGQSVAPFRNVFPIPSADIAANPKLQQNDGY